MKTLISFNQFYKLYEAQLRRSTEYSVAITDVNYRIAKVNQLLLSQSGGKTEKVRNLPVSLLFPDFSNNFSGQKKVSPPVRHQRIDKNYERDPAQIEGGQTGAYKRITTLSAPINRGKKVTIEETNGNLTGALVNQLAMNDLQKHDFPDNLTKNSGEESEQAYMARAEFLTHITEELQALLNRIIGFSNLDLPDDKQVEYLKIVRRSTESLLRLLHDSPGIFKVQSCKSEFPGEECSLQEFFGDIVDALQHNGHKRNNTILLTYDNSLPAHSIFDKEKLWQVMNTLIGNAIKFSENSIVNVRVQKISEEKGLLNMYVEVRDHGTGIQPEMIKQILEASAQSDLSSTGSDDGRSGLSNAKRLLQSMHSDLSVRSTFGLGSTFYFTLPIKMSRPLEKEFAHPFEVAPALEEKFNDPVRVPSPPGKQKEFIQSVSMNKKADSTLERKYRILLAEDNEINQMLTERLLQIQGYETTVVSNGVLALKKYESEEFDLLLIDIQMPEMDGMELIRRIREKEKITKTHVPVLVLTAHMMPDDLRSFIASGADGCITKPVMMDQLRTSIQTALRSKV